MQRTLIIVKITIDYILSNITANFTTIVIYFYLDCVSVTICRLPLDNYSQDRNVHSTLMLFLHYCTIQSCYQTLVIVL